MLLVPALSSCGSRDDILHDALVTGRLAALPPSAHALRVHTSGNTFARVFWLHFAAEPEEIEACLASSRGLSEGERDKAMPPAAVPAAGTGDHAPSRFDPSIVTLGRLFTIPRDEDADSGWILVDDARHEVIARLSHS